MSTQENYELNYLTELTKKSILTFLNDNPEGEIPFDYSLLSEENITSIKTTIDNLLKQMEKGIEHFSTTLTRNLIDNTLILEITSDYNNANNKCTIIFNSDGTTERTFNFEQY